MIIFYVYATAYEKWYNGDRSTSLAFVEDKSE